MSRNRCKGCRWFARYTGQTIGECRRYPPQHPDTLRDKGAWLVVNETQYCGEWTDAKLTAEQAERQELTMRFALAIVQGLFANPEGDMVDVMTEAQRLANELLAQKEGQQ